MYCPDGIHKENIEMQDDGNVDIGDDVAFGKYSCPVCGSHWLLILNSKE